MNKILYSYSPTICGIFIVLGTTRNTLRVPGLWRETDLWYGLALYLMVLCRKRLILLVKGGISDVAPFLLQYAHLLVEWSIRHARRVMCEYGNQSGEPTHDPHPGFGQQRRAPWVSTVLEFSPWYLYSTPGPIFHKQTTRPLP